MAKKSSIEKNSRRAKLAKQKAPTRQRLKELARDRDAAPEDRFAAQLKLSELPRNSSPTRIRNRCEMTGRPRGFYRKFKLSRIAVRELASAGRRDLRGRGVDRRGEQERRSHEPEMPGGHERRIIRQRSRPRTTRVDSRFHP